MKISKAERQPSESTIAVAALCDSTTVNTDGSLTVIHRFKPNDMVWTLINNEPKYIKIISVTTEHRSLISTTLKLSSKIEYHLSNGFSKSADSVFATKQELIQSLINKMDQSDETDS